MKTLICSLVVASAALPAMGGDLNVTVTTHSPTEIAMAAAAGYSSVEEWYADLNKAFLRASEALEIRTWNSLRPERQRSLYDAELKWRHWYATVPDIHTRRKDAVDQHILELQAWLEHDQEKPPALLPPSTAEMGRPPVN